MPDISEMDFDPRAFNLDADNSAEAGEHSNEERTVNPIELGDLSELDLNKFDSLKGVHRGYIEESRRDAEEQHKEAMRSIVSRRQVARPVCPMKTFPHF